ncbi:MAG: L-glutamate gamma-semialdehyde dehydrogenase [Myxococcota bacterium]
MSLGLFTPPPPVNEPVFAYEPGSPARAALQAEYKHQRAQSYELAPIINGKAVHTGEFETLLSPHDTATPIGKVHQAGPEHAQQAIEAALKAKPAWAALPWEERASVFLRAAALLRTKYRATLNAATMLGQSKTAHQAEIDAACELIDFLAFNAHYLSQIMQDQPQSPTGLWNRVESRPLDGFVFAITPFNFTAIAGNLPSAPAMCGNTVVWKPAATAMLSAHFVMKLFEEAGLPPGVINLIPGDGPAIGGEVFNNPEFGGLHFTGSTGVFQHLWGQIGQNIGTYRQYPRVVGETGGKDFVLVHQSADIETVAVGLLRGAYEFQGQKCSAASRAYVPKSMWPQLRERLGAFMADVKVGDVSDFRNFMGAVIDAKSYGKLTGAIDEARGNVGSGVTEVIGGEYDDSKGYFIRPTMIVADDPKYRTMREELFGPVLSVFVYDDDKWDDVLTLVDTTTDYALTGAVFATDRHVVHEALNALRFSAGNFYVNDKPTGAVVGQQPFGGSRASGTNDKAGSALNLMRWISTRTIKENFDPPRTWRYPFMAGE